MNVISRVASIEQDIDPCSFTLYIHKCTGNISLSLRESETSTCDQK